MKAKTDPLLDRSQHIQHEWNLFFANIGAWSEDARSMDLVDGTRISHALARKLPLSCTTGRFPERMSQTRCLCEAEKRMIHRIYNVKVGEVCDVMKEVASTTLL
jgi:hypothetical protein